MLIDRKDLDNQTTTEFTKFASEFNTGISSGNAKSNSLIVGTGSAKELSDTLLSDSNSNTVIITTRQKLEAALRYAQRQEEQKEPTVLRNYWGNILSLSWMNAIEH